MSIAVQYAKALYQIQTSDVRPSRTSDVQVLQNLRAALKRRGHERLLPHIFSEYEKLVLREQRTKTFKEGGAERERTRVLYELYQTLIHSSTSSL